MRDRHGVAHAVAHRAFGGAPESINPRDVNDAFERRYGYSRDQLIGRTLSEVGPWDNPNERRRIIDEARNSGTAHGLFTRLRKSSGELVDSIISAETVQLDGSVYLLAISEDAPNQANESSLLNRRSAGTR